MKKTRDPGEKTTDRSREVASLLAAARAVLENNAFADAARAILGACKTIIGADAGLVAVRPAGGKNLKVAILDPGSLDLDATQGLPPPLQDLTTGAMRGRTVFANDLSDDEAGMPSVASRAILESALLAPIVIANEVEGLLGLINKSGGFSATDSRLAEVFAEMIAVAMAKGRTVNGLEKHQNALELEARESASQLQHSEDTFRTLVQNLPDVIARYDSDLRHIYVSPSIQNITGQPAQDYIGKTNRESEMPSALVEQWDLALRRVFATGQPERLEFAYPVPDRGIHFDCRLVPEPGPGGTITSVLSIARDVTELWQAHEAERRARTIADGLREATVELTRSLNRESVLTTLLNRLLGMVPFDRACVMLVEDPSRVSVRAVFDGQQVCLPAAEVRSEFDPTDHPVVLSILSTGNPVLIPDLRTRLDWKLPTDHSAEASWIGVPLFARGTVAGLVSLSKREPDYYSQDHVKLAEAMSSQASVAVENAVLFEQMQVSTVRMQALAHRLVEAQESERRHIARELHDEAGQTLVSLRYGLRLLEREIVDGGNPGARVAELVQRTDAVIDGLHRLAADLRPASLDHLGLEAALREHSRSAGAAAGIEVRFKARGSVNDRLPPDVETALYRVVQEAMTNVARHARATRVDVLLDRRDDRVTVMVEDDGVGFQPSQVSRSHFGLLGLQERADALGGTLTIESAPGAGTTIVVEVSSANPHPDR